MNSWMTLLGIGKTTPHERELAAARARAARRRSRGRYRAYWRERNAERAEYFNARDKEPKRKKYLADWRREYRAEKRENAGFDGGQHD